MNTTLTAPRHFTASITKESSTMPGFEQTTISSPALDRDGDTIDPHGADLTSFRRNGPVLFAHRADELPVGQAERVWTDGQGNLRMSWRWLENDAFADRVRNAWQQGILRGASIGFLPKSAQPNRHGGSHYDAWELCEVSLCAVPSNPSAVRQLKSMGLWDDRSKSWDDDLEISAEQLASIPRIARQIIEDALGARRGRDEVLEIDDNVFRRGMQQLPQIVAETLHAEIGREVATALRRLRGRVD